MPQYHTEQALIPQSLTPQSHRALRANTAQVKAPKTPKSTQDVDILINELNRQSIGKGLQPAVIKICKCAKQALSTSITQRILNKEIIAKQKEKGRKQHRGNQSKERILDAETIRLRSELEQAKSKAKVKTKAAKSAQKKASAIAKYYQQTIKSFNSIIQCYPQAKIKNGITMETAAKGKSKLSVNSLIIKLLIKTPNVPYTSIKNEAFYIIEGVEIAKLFATPDKTKKVKGAKAATATTSDQPIQITKVTTRGRTVRLPHRFEA